MRAWNGNTALSVGSILNFQPGQSIANTTVIPLNRADAAYPGSGYKRDFAVYNNSPGTVDVIVDVVGYMVESTATPLDCYTSLGSSWLIATGWINTDSAACATGYTQVVAVPQADSLGVYITRTAGTYCRFRNENGYLATVYCDTRCCRLPGR
jgi:hypothetical protein